MNAKRLGTGQRILCALVIAGIGLAGDRAFGQATQPAEVEKTTSATSAPTTEAAQAPPNYSGPLLTRSTITGDWGGVRNKLAEKGMTFDLSVTQTYQGVTGGGQNAGRLGVPRPGSNTRVWQYSGVGDFLFNLDTGAAGLWPGGFFTVESEGDWGNDSRTNRQTGAILPANFNAIYLTPVQNGIAVTDVSYAQFLSDHAGLFFGKIATISQTSGDMNDFAHGKGDSQFLNLAFNFNPVSLIAPYSTLGAGVIILPGKTPDDAEISVAALDPNGQPGTAGFNTLGQDGTLFTGEARLRTHFFGLTGHQDIGGIYSDKLYTSLNQNLRLIVQTRQLQPTSGSWCVSYNFDQYVQEFNTPSGQHGGWGVFGRFGAADSHSNPTQFFWSLGIGGRGMIESRPNDGFGIGYYNSTISNANVPAFFGLRNEWGMEAFYNFAITPWCQFTPDVQYIDGARPNSSPAWVMGVRLKLVF